MLNLRNILHPTDFSELSQHAFTLACSLARDHGAKIIVLHVYPPPVNYGEIIARQQPEPYEDVLRHNLEEIRCLDGSIEVEHHLVEGEPAKEIVRLATEMDCDMIVMGTHGRTGLGRLFMGSTAEAVVRHAPCPVLTLKTPLSEEAAVPVGESTTAAV
jgi:nucleotide-binding universal stress UspA family protein